MSGCEGAREAAHVEFEKSEMGDTLDKIERIKTLVNIALTGDLFTLT